MQSPVLMCCTGLYRHRTLPTGALLEPGMIQVDEEGVEVLRSWVQCMQNKLSQITQMGAERA